MSIKVEPFGSEQETYILIGNNWLFIASFCLLNICWSKNLPQKGQQTRANLISWSSAPAHQENELKAQLGAAFASYLMGVGVGMLKGNQMKI